MKFLMKVILSIAIFASTSCDFRIACDINRIGNNQLTVTHENINITISAKTSITNNIGNVKFIDLLFIFKDSEHVEISPSNLIFGHNKNYNRISGVVTKGFVASDNSINTLDSNYLIYVEDILRATIEITDELKFSDTITMYTKEFISVENKQILPDSLLIIIPAR